MPPCPRPSPKVEVITPAVGATDRPVPPQCPPSAGRGRVGLAGAAPGSSPPVALLLPGPYRVCPQQARRRRRAAPQAPVPGVARISRALDRYRPPTLRALGLSSVRGAEMRNLSPLTIVLTEQERLRVREQLRQRAA
ncbi:hypothetical protein GCM10022140_31440 [Rhodococcus aetherivorans]